jgi:putative ABC transport system substrate-binding protein
MSIRRRDFLGALSGAAAWPLAARAQQPVIPVIGFLTVAPRGPTRYSSDAFRQGLGEAGYVLGTNLAAEYRWANFNSSLLRTLADELVGRRVAVIVTEGSPYAAVEAKAATSTIPIIFIVDEDPVKYGLVAALNRPSGNATGITFLTAQLAGKRLNLLLELAPQVSTVGYLSGPSESPIFEALRSDMVAAGHELGREIVVGEVRRLDFEAAFANLVERRVGALIVGNYTLFSYPPNRDKILELAAYHKLPAMYPGREDVVRGGLMSYGASFTELVRQAGTYTGRVLKGERPSNLPVVQPSKFQFVLNLKTAKMLGIAVPPIVLALATAVIE